MLLEFFLVTGEGKYSMLSSMFPCYQLYIITYKDFKAFCFIGTLNVTITNVNVKQKIILMSFFL